MLFLYRNCTRTLKLTRMVKMNQEVCDFILSFTIKGAESVCPNLELLNERSHVTTGTKLISGLYIF